MKYLFLLVFPVILFFSCDSQPIEDDTTDLIIEAKPKYTFTTFEQKISYCIGLDHGASSKLYLTTQMVGKFRNSEVEKGMVHYLAGDELRILPSELDSIFNLYLKVDGSVDSSIVSCADGSYAYGISEGNVLVASLVARGIDQTIVVDLLIAGIEDGIRGAAPSVPLKEARIEVVSYYSGINKDMGENFLAQNAQRENVFTTESGLQYEIFLDGNGTKPNVTDTVIIHYTGRFVDGREFESTIPSRVPAKLTLLNAIQGWTEGVQKMKEGSQFRFFVPYQLAYGEKGRPGIEPFSAIVYDVELLKVIKYVPNN